MREDVVREPGITITPDVRILVRRTGLFIVFDRRHPLGAKLKDYPSAASAEEEARRVYASEIKPKQTTQSKSDEDAFAAMKRALERGFAKHEPAE